MRPAPHLAHAPPPGGSAVGLRQSERFTGDQDVGHPLLDDARLGEMELPTMSGKRSELLQGSGHAQQPDDEIRRLCERPTLLLGEDKLLSQLLFASSANTVFKDGWTPTLVAAKSGNAPALVVLLSFGADVNVIAPDGVTCPLLLAASWGHLQAALLLQTSASGASLLLPSGSQGLDSFTGSSLPPTTPSGMSSSALVGKVTASSVARRFGHADVAEALERACHRAGDCTVALMDQPPTFPLEHLFSSSIAVSVSRLAETSAPKKKEPLCLWLIARPALIVLPALASLITIGFGFKEVASMSTFDHPLRMTLLAIFAVLVVLLTSAGILLMHWTNEDTISGMVAQRNNRLSYYIILLITGTCFFTSSFVLGGGIAREAFHKETENWVVICAALSPLATLFILVFPVVIIKRSNDVGVLPFDAMYFIASGPDPLRERLWLRLAPFPSLSKMVHGVLHAGALGVGLCLWLVPQIRRLFLIWEGSITGESPMQNETVIETALLAIFLLFGILFASFKAILRFVKTHQRETVCGYRIVERIAVAAGGTLVASYDQSDAPTTAPSGGSFEPTLNTKRLVLWMEYVCIYAYMLSLVYTSMVAGDLLRPDDLR